MLNVTAALVAPTVSMSHNRDGTPIEDCECRRLRIYAINVASCEVPGTKTGNCLPDIVAKYFAPALDEALRSGMCRDPNTTTWSELMEEWLTLPVPPPI